MKAEIFRGDTWLRGWSITVDGTPLNLTGAVARLQLKKSMEDSTPILNLSSEDVTGELQILEPKTDGKIKLRVQTEPLNLEKGKYLFDLEVKLSDGTIKTYEQGTLVINLDVTR